MSHEVWTIILSSMSFDRQKEVLEYVLRTRRKHMYFSINGKYEHVPRAKVRDWLRDSLGVK